MGYILKRCNDAIYNATRKIWTEELQVAEDSFSPTGYFTLLDSVELRLSKPLENIYHYALVEDTGSDVAVAILEISHVLPNLPTCYLKVLSIRMSPRLDTRNTNTEQNNRLTRHKYISTIAGSCVANALKLSDSELPAASIKVYSTAQTDIEMLLYITDSLKDSVLKDAGIDVDRRGYWLEVTKTEKN